MTEQPTENSNENTSSGDTPVLGIISTICGGASLAPFLGIISPVGLVLGIIGLKKEKKKTLSIIGTVLSVIGILTSPILWCITGIADCDEKADTEEISMMDRPAYELVLNNATRV